MPTRAGDRRRAQAVAAAGLRQATGAGQELPSDLRIWGLAGAEPESWVEADASGNGGGAAVDLAVVLERSTSAVQRRAKGLHVTPDWLADHLVGRALTILPAAAGGPAVCDPACGGGAFLLAAARALERRGLPRRQVVRESLWGADVDPVGLAAAELALALWAGEAPPPGRLVVGDALARGAGLWPDAPSPGFSVVVGNPPFLNQLGRATTRSAAAAGRLRRRFGDAVQPYTDAAWLFLLLGCDLVRPGGAVTMVQPLSVVAARDASAVRGALAGRAELRELWVEDRARPAFAASVQVCAPLLVAPPSSPPVAVAGERVWADRLADAVGAPRVALDEGDVVRLGTLADVAAGFRDEYYGLVPLVREASDGGSAEEAPLVTTGAVDWGRSGWGERPVRFAKRSWKAPVVDLAGLRGLDPSMQTTRAVRRWIERTSGPKLLVANQTRVVEPAVDRLGAWVPSVPTLAVVPYNPDDLWLVAAAVGSPTATAWLWRRAPGTALSRDALKIAPRDLADLPLPSDRVAWSAAAEALDAYVARPTDSAFEAYVDAAAAAYGAPPELVAWWRARVPPRIDSTPPT